MQKYQLSWAFIVLLLNTDYSLTYVRTFYDPMDITQPDKDQEDLEYINKLQKCLTYWCSWPPDEFTTLI